MRKLFVYGTLKEGYGNHRLLQGCKKLGNYTLPVGEFCLVDLGWYPGVVHRHVLGLTTPVTGEVYEVDDETARAVDGLEGYPSLYDREEVETPYGAAWVYTYNMSHGRLNVDESVLRNGVWPREGANE